MRNNINSLLVIIVVAAISSVASAANAAPKNGQLTSSDVIKPEQLIKLLSGKMKPLVLQVGFDFLYQGGHIDRSIWAGPASRPDGITRLENAVRNVPRDKEIVLYCGCCPWTECPNIQPAFDTVRKLGFKNVKVLYIPSDFEHDWIRQGYPIEKSGERSSK